MCAGCSILLRIYCQAQRFGQDQDDCISGVDYMARLLVVEDDIDLLFLYQTMLARLGYEVTPAEKTSDALMLLSHDEFDLIILDMNMPDMPGIKVLEHMRDDASVKQTPVVVVSANAQWRGPCFDLGVEHFLIKPVPTRELFSLLNELLAV